MAGGSDDNSRKAQREARLAEQLRANLARRKAQARQRKSGEPASSDEKSGSGSRRDPD